MDQKQANLDEIERMKELHYHHAELDRSMKLRKTKDKFKYDKIQNV